MRMAEIGTARKLVLTFCMFGCIRMEVFDREFEKTLDAYVEKTMECRHVPGLTISVVKGSDTWTRSYGMADFSNNRKVDNSTLFNIASVTKSFTMVLLGILLTEKGLDWNTKVHTILGPDYEFIDENRSKEMTLRDLLSHRTGLARLDIGLLAGFPDSLTREQFCKNLKYLPAKIPFRDAFIYNNYMFTLLGHVAEKLGGDSWEKLVTSRVLSPIGMMSTRIMKHPADVLTDTAAKPYIYKDNTFQNGTHELYRLYPGEPAGAILSTGEDMAKYIRFNLKGGVTENGKQLLDLELLLKAFTVTTPIIDTDFLESYSLTLPEFPVSDTQTGYGHGWFTSTYRGYHRIWHSGGMMSYITYLWMLPDINAGMFASVNGPALKHLASKALRSIFYFISDKLTDEEAWLNETTTCEYPDHWRHKTSNSSPPKQFTAIDNPSQYVGYFVSSLLPGINISTQSGDKASLAFQMNRYRGLLHGTEEKDNLLMEVTAPWEYMQQFIRDNHTIYMNTTFLRNDKGAVQSVEVEYDAKVVYTKVIDSTASTGAHHFAEYTLGCVFCLILTCPFNIFENFI